MSSLGNQDYWLGMNINSERYALPASKVHSVFLHSEPEQLIKQLKISGVVVHDGEPVYLRTHFQLLKPGRGIENIAPWRQVLKREQAPWIVVLKDGHDRGLGFRVNGIVGPFHCPVNAHSPYLQYNGSNFYLVEDL